MHECLQVSELLYLYKKVLRVRIPLSFAAYSFEIGSLLEPTAHFSCLGWKPASSSNAPVLTLLVVGVTGVCKMPALLCEY